MYINELVAREDKKMLAKDKPFIMPNINEEAKMFEWAGVSFGEEQTYLLNKAVKV